MANSDQKARDTLAADETDELISSEKVDSTAVYNRDGDSLGTVHNLMIDKITTVQRTKLGDLLGRLSDDDLVRLGRAIVVFLGLARA